MEWVHFFITMVPCLALVLIAWRAAERGRYVNLMGSCGGLFFWGLLSVSGVLALQSMLTFALAVFWTRLKPRPRTAVLGASACFLVPFTFAALLALGGVQERNEVQRQIPIVSLADRLSYEPANAVAETSTAPLPAEIIEPFDELELRELKASRFRRIGWENLHAMHTSVVREFMYVQGFGIGRMFRMDGRYFTRPSRSYPVPQPSGDYVPLASASGDSQPAPSALDQWEFHRAGLVDFFDGERLGHAKHRNHTVGFEAHRFTDGFDSSQAIGEPAWKLNRLELVSLLKHERPRVYVSENLPNMDELREMPTRPVTPFEASAVEQLRRDQNLVTEADGNLLHMLGAIRASETCLKCHNVQHGHLLGAFSYELVPVDAAARRKADAPAF